MSLIIFTFAAPVFATYQSGIASDSVSTESFSEFTGYKSGELSGDSPRGIDEQNALFTEYKKFIVGFLGVCILTCVLTMVYSFMLIGVGAATDNVMEKTRRKGMKGVLISGASLAILGSITFWYCILVNFSLF